MKDLNRVMRKLIILILLGLSDFFFFFLSIPPNNNLDVSFIMLDDNFNFFGHERIYSFGGCLWSVN
jgi:hypothetical protein